MVKFETVGLHIGDWSSDGHGMSDTFYYSVPEGTDIYNHAVDGMAEHGIDLGEICSNYDDPYFPTSKLRKLEGLGMDVQSVFEDYDPNKEMTFVSEPSSFADAFMFLSALHGGFEYSPVDRGLKTYRASIGYGLYSL